MAAHGRPRRAACIATIGLAVTGTALQLAACGGGAVAERPAVHSPGTGYRAGAVHDRSVAPSPLAVLRGGAPDAAFARADVVRAFHFPRDHGPHPDFRHEWWYFTGHLRGADGERFGFEVTFFRIALAPPSADSGAGAPGGESASRWRARQIYVAHFAVTDVARGTFHSTQRFARDALGLAGAQAAPFRVWLGSWSVARRDAGTQTAADRSEASDWTLHAADPDYALTLELHPLTAPVLNGDRGLSVKSGEPGSASYYYSIPRLAVRGAIVRHGGKGGSHPIEVRGTAWLDREWGSGSLGAHQQGWDWFALQFADGSALMFYALRDHGGARDPHSAGTWIAADGSSRPLASSDVRIDVLSHWTSPSGARYPSRWRVRVGSLGLDVMGIPVLADQELDTTPRYWEGDVDVSGTRAGRRLTGQGYVELVGYAGR